MTHTVAIVGAGLSGIAAARECEVRGIDYVVLEMDEKVGGTWHTQRFPGIRADSLHIQNLYSFHPVPSESITTGPWLQEYLEDVARTHGVFQKIRFKTKVLGVNWDSAGSVWQLTVQDVGQSGSQKSSLQARFLFNANGYFDLHQPNIPKQFRLAESTFEGKMIHSAKMTSVDHDDLKDKNVVLVGSGATATTMVPELLKTVKSLAWVFRTPSHCVPIFRLPWIWAVFHNWLIRLHNRGTTWPFKIYRFIFLSFIQGYMQLMANYLPKAFVRWVYALWNGTPSDKFAKFFKPSYEFGFQRVCLVDDLSTMVQDPKLRMVKGEVAGIRDSTFTVNDANNGGDPTVIEGVDTVVLCTGYDLNYFKFQVSIDGTPIQMPQQVLRRELLFESLPNFFFLCMFNRLTPVTTTSATPGLEVMCKMSCRLVSYVETNGYKSFQIKPEEPSKVDKLLPMISNYVQRNKDRCFQGIKEESDDACRWRYMFWERPFKPEEYTFVK